MGSSPKTPAHALHAALHYPPPMANTEGRIPVRYEYSAGTARANDTLEEPWPSTLNSLLMLSSQRQSPAPGWHRVGLRAQTVVPPRHYLTRCLNTSRADTPAASTVSTTPFLPSVLSAPLFPTANSALKPPRGHTLTLPPSANFRFKAELAISSRAPARRVGDRPLLSSRCQTAPPCTAGHTRTIRTSGGSP